MWVSRVLGQDSVNAWTSGNFFKVLIQAVLLFELDKWVVTPHVVRILGGFHHRMTHQLTGNHHRRLPDGGWDYPNPPLVEALRGVLLEEV